MSSIVQELRTSKRQLVDTFDVGRRHGSTNDGAVADNNNNDDGYYNTLLSSHVPAAGLWNRGRPAVTPTSSSSAPRRTGQSRSKRRRRHGHGPAGLCYDECGALDLTSTKNVVRTSNTAARPPSILLSPAAMNLVTDDSVPLDLSVRRQLPYVNLSTFHCV